MARKKDPPKPLLATKFQFVESLDAFIQEAVTLTGLVEMCINHGNLPPPIKEKLGEQLEKFKAALFAGDPE